MAFVKEGPFGKHASILPFLPPACIVQLPMVHWWKNRTAGWMLIPSIRKDGTRTTSDGHLRTFLKRSQHLSIAVS